MYFGSWFHTFQSLVGQLHGCGLWADGASSPWRRMGQSKAAHLMTERVRKKWVRTRYALECHRNDLPFVMTFHSAPIPEKPKDSICILMIQASLNSATCWNQALKQTFSGRGPRFKTTATTD